MRFQPRLPFEFERRRLPVLEAPSNAEALAWLARGDWPQGRLAIWGPAGSGKSAMLREWAGEVVAGAALLFGPVVGRLAIDDADRAEERALLHMLNAAAEAGVPVLLAARAAPARWGTGLPDLASRLRATMAVGIGAPEDDLLAKLLARLLTERQLRVPETMCAWLLARLPRSHAAIGEAVRRLDEAGAGIAPGVARVVLADMLADLPEDDVLESLGAAGSPGEAGFL